MHIQYFQMMLQVAKFSHYIRGLKMQEKVNTNLMKKKTKT